MHHEEPNDTSLPLFRDESYAIQGAIFEVSREIGTGFLEGVYQECLAIEFGLRGIPFEKEKELPMAYKGRPIDLFYRCDFVCYGSIIVELKTVGEIRPEHRAQLLNYMRAATHRLGLLVNYGKFPKATVERLVL